MVALQNVELTTGKWINVIGQIYNIIVTVFYLLFHIPSSV